MPTDTKLANLVLNVLTQEQYEAAEKNENELYLIVGDDYVTAEKLNAAIESIDAANIKFADGQTWQQKYDAGEFRGQDGEDGSNGKDGVSATHAWNGTTLTVTSASGTSSADLKGDKGDPGYTPQKGTDYWTAADKAEMVNDVLAALPAAEGGSY